MTRSSSTQGNITGTIGQLFLTKKKDFISPNINYVCFDRIKLRVEEAYIVSFHSVQDYDYFKSCLAQHRQIFSRWFNNTFTFHNDLLFGGILKTTAYHGPLADGRPHSYKVSLALELNVTRAVHHAYYNSPSAEDFSFGEYLRNTPREYALRKCTTPRADRIIGLDGEDNVLDTVTLLNLRPGRMAFQQYLATVLATIDDVIQICAPHSEAARLLRPMNKAQIVHAECYWEYLCPDAIGLVKWLQDSITHLFTNARVANYIYGSVQANDDYQRTKQKAPTVGRRINCPSMTLGLGNKNIELVIYSKLPTRPRFEIKFHGNLKQLLRLEDSEMNRSIAEQLDTAIERAHGYLHRVFKFIPTGLMPEKVKYVSFTYFCRAIGKLTAQHAQLTEILFPALLYTGGITVDTGTIEHNVCLRLKRAGIVQLSQIARPRRNTQRFVLMPIYRPILQLLLPPAPVNDAHCITRDLPRIL